MAVTKEAKRRVKLQHFLVLRAFNLRRPQETFEQQFQGLKTRIESENRNVLDLDALCTYLSIPPFRRFLLVHVFALKPHETQLDFDAFVGFLQSAALSAAKKEREENQACLLLPLPPSRSHQTSDVLVAFDPSRSSFSTIARAPPAPGLWKKREVTIQERLVEYTKIDDKGQAQRLVEKERHQTEVLHMESLDGEFAHREITQFEQTEHVNDEMVHLDHGREEFLHLKSHHDEMSRFESSVPSTDARNGRQPEECEQQPPSPTIKRDFSTTGSLFHGVNSMFDLETKAASQAAETLETK